MDLFNIPPAVISTGPTAPIPAGGLGSGHFLHSPEGEFRDWRMQPGASAGATDVPANRFHFWWRQGVETHGLSLATAQNPRYDWPDSHIAPACRRLFPFEWRDFNELEGPVQLQSLHFSPLIPGS